MLTIARHQLMQGLLDAKFIFMATIILVAFIINGFVYSGQYAAEMSDWEDSLHTSLTLLEQQSGSLQQLSAYEQIVMRPPSALLFIREAGDQLLPNTYKVNAYYTRSPKILSRTNERLPLLPAIDWSFIIGGLMSLMAVLLSFTAICGEKRDGTLRYVLSNPVSRLAIFLGKFIGLAAVMFLVLGIGILVNVLVIITMGSIRLTGAVLSNIVFTGALGYLYLTFFIFLGLAVSSMTSRPAVSLVVLLIVWILIVVAMPGLSRLIPSSNLALQTVSTISGAGTPQWIRSGQIIRARRVIGMEIRMIPGFHCEQSWYWIWYKRISVSRTSILARRLDRSNFSTPIHPSHLWDC